MRMYYFAILCEVFIEDRGIPEVIERNVGIESTIS